MISCARATRSLEDPRWTRAVGDQSSPPSRKNIEERLSLDVRNEGQFS